MDIQPIKDEEYILHIGLVTVIWANLETALDFMVATTFQSFGGHPKHAEIPRSLARKIRYLIDVAEKPELQAWSSEIIAIAGEVSSLKEQRHTAVHGITLSNADPKTYRIMRIVYEKMHHRSPEFNVSLEDLRRLCGNAVTLCKRTFTVLDEMREVSEKTID